MEGLAVQSGLWSPARLCCNGAGNGSQLRARVLSRVVSTRATQTCLYEREKVERVINRPCAAATSTLYSGRKGAIFRVRAVPEEAVDDIIVEEAEEPAASAVETVPEETVPEEDTTPKAKVTFTLSKEVYFGQAFNVVGSSPQLGEWDPAAAVPMVWAEGHVWTTDVALPVGQTFEYKFILTGKFGELEWQPGENRLVEIVDESDLVITEFWDPPDSATELSEETVQNGVAPGTDVSESITIVVDQAAELVGKTADDLVSELKELVNDDTNGKPGAGVEEEKEEESSELPVVDAALATAVAEVRAGVADPAEAEV